MRCEVTEYLALTNKRLLNGHRVTVTHGSADGKVTYCGREIDRWYVTFPALERSRLSCNLCIAAKLKGQEDHGEEHSTCGNLELPHHEG